MYIAYYCRAVELCNCPYILMGSMNRQGFGYPLCLSRLNSSTSSGEELTGKFRGNP